MIISSRQISKEIHKNIVTSSDPSKLARALYNYLKSNHLIHLLSNILRHLEKFEEQRSKQRTVFIKSPYELSGKAMKEIENHTKSWDAEKYITSIDESLIGGVVIQGNGHHYDASIKQNLQSLKKLLSQQK